MAQRNAPDNLMLESGVALESHYVKVEKPVQQDPLTGMGQVMSCRFWFDTAMLFLVCIWNCTLLYRYVGMDSISINQVLLEGTLEIFLALALGHDGKNELARCLAADSKRKSLAKNS